ncbi:MAG: hypothetical protein L3J39_12390 [Verrucomicrobiales bacterium]|nr:hypothetical protein [Verrucomicrobiales bacterium]
MPSEHPAFSAGEFIILADKNTLEELENKCSKVFLLCDVLATHIASHAGQRFFIKKVSMFHMGIPLYELEGIPHHWVEESILDLSLHYSEHEIYSRASDHYHAKANVKSGRGLVQILDTKNQICCSLIKDHAAQTANSINEVAQIRSKMNFETRYGFDGEYSIPEQS